VAGPARQVKARTAWIRPSLALRRSATRPGASQQGWPVAGRRPPRRRRARDAADGGARSDAAGPVRQACPGVGTRAGRPGAPDPGMPATTGACRDRRPCRV